MWLGQYQRRPNQEGEGQVGRVTIGGEQTAVLLDSERRGLEVYAPGGYRWTPRVDQKVLVIQGRGEIPCVVGVRQDCSERGDGGEPRQPFKLGRRGGGADRGENRPDGPGLY